MGKDKTTEILKNHFKALYDYTGMEWTPNSDEHIKQFVDELEEIIEEKINTPTERNFVNTSQL